MVHPEGLEPPTYCLEGNCSIQLSYGCVYGADDENRTRTTSLGSWGSTTKLHPHVNSALLLYHNCPLFSRGQKGIFCDISAQ